MRRTFCALALLLLGCSESPTMPPVTGACMNPDLISLPACETGADRFSDEACTVLDDALTRSLVTDTARAPAITAPTQDQALPGGTPFTFAWSEPTARRALPPRRPMTWRDELARWTTLIPEAQAHCVPFSGWAYELRFVINGMVVIRRQQSLSTYTPDAARWNYLRTTAAGRPIELRIATARMSSNQVGRGPFIAAEARRFTITP
jgi:hypothetical protein